MPQMFVLTVLGAIAAPRAAILVSNHANMHKHTLAEAHSPGDGDHLLHYLSVEGDNHPQFLCDKEHNKNTINKGTLGGACNRAAPRAFSGLDLPSQLMKVTGLF